MTKVYEETQGIIDRFALDDSKYTTISQSAIYGLPNVFLETEVNQLRKLNQGFQEILDQGGTN